MPVPRLQHSWFGPFLKSLIFFWVAVCLSCQNHRPLSINLHWSRPLSDKIFKFIVEKEFFSIQNVKSENFMQGEKRDENFLNSRLRGFNEATRLKQASKYRSFALAAGEQYKRVSQRI